MGQSPHWSIFRNLWYVSLQKYIVAIFKETENYIYIRVEKSETT